VYSFRGSWTLIEQHPLRHQLSVNNLMVSPKDILHMYLSHLDGDDSVGLLMSGPHCTAVSRRLINNKIASAEGLMANIRRQIKKAILTSPKA
jgi:hypothetical protein